MRIITSKKAKKVTFTLIVVLIAIAVLFNLMINFVDIEEVATALNINKYEVRSDLLMTAMDNVGVAKPEEAIAIWSNGLKMRSAAMQYSVMTTKLKGIYAAQLEKTFSNWVTGMSSPWVDSYKILSNEKKNDNTNIYTVSYITMTSTGPAGEYKAKLTVVKEKDFWRISTVVTDKELVPYTGFKL